MEEPRWTVRLLSEIGSARSAIATSYLSLWRTGGRLSETQPGEPPPPASSDEPPPGGPACGERDAAD